MKDLNYNKENKDNYAQSIIESKLKYYDLSFVESLKNDNNKGFLWGFSFGCLSIGDLFLANKEFDNSLWYLSAGFCGIVSLIFFYQALINMDKIKEIEDINKKYLLLMEYKDEINSMLRENAKDFYQASEDEIPTIDFSNIFKISLQELEEIVENGKQMKLIK